MSDLLKISPKFWILPKWLMMMNGFNSMLLLENHISPSISKESWFFFNPWHRRCFIRPKPSQIVVEGSGLYRYLELPWFSISSRWVSSMFTKFFFRMEIWKSEVWIRRWLWLWLWFHAALLWVSWWFTHGFMYTPVNEHSNGKWNLNEDVFPIEKNRDIPASWELCEFTRGYP